MANSNMGIDIFNPTISVVSHGLEGKVIMLYGGNSTGKTYQSVRMPKPYVLRCESGLNAQNGVPFANIQTWADLLFVISQLTSPSTVNKAKDLYSTIIIDEVYASAQYCQKYICNKYKSPSIGEGNGGYGLWDKYETEYWSAINTIVSSGYTVVFIAHATDKDGQIYPKGDKRSIQPIMDNCDIIAYLQSNGVDEDNKVVHSSAYLAEIPGEYFARSRFDYIDPIIEDFTAQNLEKAIKEAVEKQEAAEGFQSVSFEEQVQNNAVEKITFTELKNQVTELGTVFCEKGHQDRLKELIADCLGEGNFVQDATERQYESLEILLGKLKEEGERLGMKVS